MIPKLMLCIAKRFPSRIHRLCFESDGEYKRISNTLRARSVPGTAYNNTGSPRIVRRAEPMHASCKSFGKPCWKARYCFKTNSQLAFVRLGQWRLEVFIRLNFPEVDKARRRVFGLDLGHIYYHAANCKHL